MADRRRIPNVLLKLKINPAWAVLGGGVAGLVFGAVR